MAPLAATETSPASFAHGQEEERRYSAARDDLRAGFTRYKAADCPEWYWHTTADKWMRDKRRDDGYGHLWRVHDDLYDLSSFMDRHPGGREWLRVTQGMDVTEVFEASHLNADVGLILKKYLVGPAVNERNSPFTFHQDGFYMTLKRRAHQQLRSISPEKVNLLKLRAVFVQAALLTLLTLAFISTIVFQSTMIAIVTGVVLVMNQACSHNFIHKRDNWFMYIWDLTVESSFEFRITHAISHHMFPNTVYDFELRIVEPLADLRVHSGKNILQKSLLQNLILIQLTAPLMRFGEAVKRWVTIAKGRHSFRLENSLPLMQLAILMEFSGVSAGAKLWFIIHLVFSYCSVMVGFFAAHHHPDIYHAGDAFRYGTDWGLCQLDAVRDRWDVDGNLLAELTLYGNHVLHHLFPTIDHGILDELRPVFRQTCRDFGIDDFDYECSPFSQWQLAVGAVRQLVRTKPRQWTL